MAIAVMGGVGYTITKNDHQSETPITTISSPPHLSQQQVRYDLRGSTVTAVKTGDPVVILATSSSTTTVEKAKDESHNEESPSTPPDESEDDYSDLPEEDEPTTCVICLINRQGPCRNPWRRFEKCMKESPPPDENKDDNSDEDRKDDVVLKCQDTSLVWLRCLDKHRMTYSIITNKHYQPEIDGIEDRYKDKKMEFKPDLLPTLDLNHWYEYLEAMEDEKMMLEDDLSPQDNNDNENNDAADVSNNDNHENFVAGYATFKIKEESTGRLIDVAYVKDQDGALIGFDYFGREKREDKPEGELIFHLTPQTTSVMVHAIYKTLPPPPSEEEKSDGEKADDEVLPETEQSDDGQLYYAVSSILRQNVDD